MNPISQNSLPAGAVKKEENSGETISSQIAAFRDEYVNVMAASGNKSAAQIVESLGEILGKVYEALNELKSESKDKKGLESLLQELEDEIQKQDNKSKNPNLAY